MAEWLKAPVSKTGIPVNPVSRVRISPCPSAQIRCWDGWPSGLRRTPGKCVYVNSVPWVRIPPRPSNPPVHRRPAWASESRKRSATRTFKLRLKERSVEYSQATTKPLRHPDENVFSVLAAEARGFAPRRLAAVGGGSGAIALAAALLGVRSWIVPAAAFALWLFSGCALFFRARPTSRLVSIAALFLLMSGIVVALAVIVGLYLLALGPSWVL